MFQDDAIRVVVIGCDKESNFCVSNLKRKELKDAMDHVDIVAIDDEPGKLEEYKVDVKILLENNILEEWKNSQYRFKIDYFENITRIMKRLFSRADVVMVISSLITDTSKNTMLFLIEEARRQNKVVVAILVPLGERYSSIQKTLSEKLKRFCDTFAIVNTNFIFEYRNLPPPFVMSIVRRHISHFIYEISFAFQKFKRAFLEELGVFMKKRELVSTVEESMERINESNFSRREVFFWHK